jgi:hypothetical protein
MSGPTLSGDRTWIELQAVRHERNALRRERDALLGKPIRLDEREHAGDPAVAWRAYHQAQERAEKAEASAAAMREALWEITQRSGPFSWDPLEHAAGVIDAMTALATSALSTPSPGAGLLEELEKLRSQKDAAYSERNKVVALLARMAPWMGWESGLARHPEEDVSWERDWMTIVFVNLPAGQASWHFHDSEQHLLGGLPRYVEPWDGHTTEEKYRRVDAALTNPCLMADHECRECGRIEQPCRACQRIAELEGKGR